MCSCMCMMVKGGVEGKTTRRRMRSRSGTEEQSSVCFHGRRAEVMRTTKSLGAAVLWRWWSAEGAGGLVGAVVGGR